AHTGFEGEELAAQGVYDVVLLDLMLPDRDGVEVCRNLRRRGVRSKVLMLTALGTTEAKVQGLDAGADDYLPNPFEFEELPARVPPPHRRGGASEPRSLRGDARELALYGHSARRNNEKIELSAKEFALLEYFMRNPDRVLSRTQICEKVWDINFELSSNIVD